MQPTLTLMVGGPGVGKSYIAQREFAGQPIVDCDAIKAEHPDYNPARPQDVHRWSSEEATRRLLSFLSRGENVVFDSTGANPDKLATFASIARNAGFRVEALLVTCDLSTALQRAANRERKVPADIIREKHAAIAGSWLVVKAFVDSSRAVENN